MDIMSATLADLPAIDDLRRKDQESLGFIPMSRYELEVERGRSTMISCFENDDLVGYLYWTRGWPVAAIQQTVIRADARRRERATALVDYATDVMVSQGRYGVTCRCRANLEAIDFWKDIGFREIRIEESGRRGPLIRFYRELKPALFDAGDYLRGPGLLVGERVGFKRKVGIPMTRPTP
jgi:ribosomal protein S18 acetylase RimI-like enzyme